MAPLLSTIGNKAYGFGVNLLKKITDTFTRTTTGSLGISTSGNLWQALTGIWYANGTQAQSDTAVNSTTNALAAIQFGRQDVKVSASVSAGTGVIFWVSDANSWWASTYYSNQTTANCNCQTCYQSCPCSSCAQCRDCTTQNTTCASYGTCSGAYGSGSVSGTVMGNGDTGGCYYYSTGAYQGPRPCNSWNTQLVCGPYYACAGTYSCNPYSCNCQTCTTTNYFLRLLQSVSGVVSEATTKVSLGSAAAAVMVNTFGNMITTKAYSDSAMTTQLGTTITLTPTTPTKGTSVGIIKTESAYGQGSVVDNFVADIGE